MYNFVNLFGGLAFFLFGMNIMSGELEALSGSKAVKLLEKISENTLKGVVFGFILTVLIQSSSAITVMLIGLVNSGRIKYKNTVGIIAGANIGTTFTSWLLCIIESSELNNSKSIGMDFTVSVIAVTGLFFLFILKKPIHKSTGKVLLGFSVLMTGLRFMSESVLPYADSRGFESITAKISNPFIGLAVGIVSSAILQSSSASVGMLQSASLAGHINYKAALSIIIGQNIGTCSTGLIASYKSDKNSVKVSVIHVLFNVIGGIVCFSLIFIANVLGHSSFLDMPVNSFGIAVGHTLFNFISALVVLPLKDVIVYFSDIIVKDEDKVKKINFNS